MRRLSEDKRIEIHRLHQAGTSQREIARILGVSRNAVARNLRLKSPVPPESLLEVEPAQLDPQDVSTTFDRRINEIIDTLLTRYREMSLSPDTSNRDLVTLGRLIGSWSMLSRPERQIELAIANFIDSVADKISHDAFTELSAALDAQTHQIEGSGAPENEYLSTPSTSSETS